MNPVELIQLNKKTYTVPEIQDMLGLGKTESYWLLQHRPFEIKILCGQMRVVKTSFDTWYDNQVKYKKVDGTPPGTALKAMSYSVPEVAALLAVSETTIYTHLKAWGVETFSVDFTTRIKKDSFERWYASQSIYRLAEDRESDQPLIADTYSMPDMMRLLHVHRNTIYYIVDKEGSNGAFEYVFVAGQKRITKASFWRWYEGQSRYKVKEPYKQEGVPDTNKASANEPNTETVPASSIPPVKSSYRVEDLMEVLGISKKAAYAMIQNFEIKAIKAGKSFIIPASSFNELLEERGITNGSSSSKA